jgi:hypothetical protein
MDFRPQWKQVPKGDVQGPGGKIEKVNGAQGGADAAVKAERVAPNAGEASFGEIAKGLGQPRPIVDKRLTYGNSADLGAAVKSVS